MRSLWVLLAVLVFSLTWIAGAAAADITYIVNDTVGVGTVEGTITTDGVLGTLGQLDIVDFNLTLFDGTQTATLNPLNGLLFISSNNVTATSTQLLFDFNSNGGFMNFFAGETCIPEWSFETVGGGTTCNGTTGNEMGVVAFNPDFPTYSAESGEVVFATTSIPEPASLFLLGSGLMGLGGVVRRARKKA